MFTRTDVIGDFITLFLLLGALDHSLSLLEAWLSRKLCWAASASDLLCNEQHQSLMFWMCKTGILTNPYIAAIPSNAAGDGASSNADLLSSPFADLKRSHICCSRSARGWGDWFGDRYVKRAGNNGSYIMPQAFFLPDTDCGSFPPAPPPAYLEATVS